MQAKKENIWKGKAIIGKSADREVWRSSGGWVMIRCTWIQEGHTCSIMPLCWWDKNIMWEVLPKKCWALYWMNKLAVSLVEEASWLQFPIGAFHCVVSWGLCVVFFLRLRLAKTWDALLFHWKGTGMHTGMPLRVFVDTHDQSALRCWQRRFVGVHSVHSLEKHGELWGCHTGYRDILDLNGNWGPWFSRWPRDLGTWFGYSNQFLLCFVSSPFFFL